MLAIILGKGRGESVLDLSTRLLKKYDFDGLENLSFEELTKECKGNKVPALQILSFIELSKRRNKKLKKGYEKEKIITSAKDIYDVLSDEMRSYKKEVLKVVLLDTKSKVIDVKDISVGILNASLIHPREVFIEAIKASAFSIILVHNHPSGNPEPSKEDLEVTEKLSKLGDELGIKVLDHVIVGEKYWSWREEN